MEKISKKKQKIAEKPQKIIEFRREEKSYYGIRYALILEGWEDQKNSQKTNIKVDETGITDNINPRIWWTLEGLNRKLCSRVASQFLWHDTESFVEARLIDKYHQCELWAVDDINWLMDGYLKWRLKFTFVESWFTVYAIVLTTPGRIIYQIKKLFNPSKWRSRHPFPKV